MNQDQTINFVPYVYWAGVELLCFFPTNQSPQVPSAQLINPNKKCSPIRLWHDQLFAKPPRHGGVVAW